MFVAHHLITVDKTFRNKLTTGVGMLPPETPNMSSDLVPKVRKLGNEAFSKHINMKKDRLTDYLADTQGELGFVLVSVNERSFDRGSLLGK